MKKIFLGLLILTTLLSTACTNIPLTTMYKMMTMKPLDIDPRQLVIAVGSPQGLSVKDGGIILDFSFKAPANNLNLDNKFMVKVNKDYPIPSELEDETEDNRKITFLQLDGKDAETMYQAQQTIKKYREHHEDGSGTFTIKIQSVCMNKGFSADDMEIDLFVKLESNEEFFTFMEGLDPTDFKSDKQKSSNIIPKCES
ncbi:hypothetical protein [Parashewanella tropica]|uniref:hypothetical protein n=1 Tax=Parashewanella tropica TaxID=2547970 RepID=UPI0010597CA1|nr:hypothetical protein [Parashewanella tropica]